MRTATVYNFLLEANIMASIAIFLMIIVRKFFRKHLGSRVIRFSWLLVAIRLLLPISLPNPWISEIRPAYLLDAGIRPIAGQIKIRLTDALSDGYYWMRRSLGGDNALTEGISGAAGRMENGIAASNLMKLYLLGVALVILWFAISNLVFCRKMKVGRIEPISGELKEQYDAVCAARGVRPVPVYFTDPLPSACLVGVFRPYIALPLTAKPNEAIQVLTHEICHLKGHDNLWNLLRLVCCAVHWFNPLIWAAAWMSRTDCELACDDRVIARMNDEEKRNYASVLVLSATRRNAPGILTMATGMTMTGKRLKSRVESILRSGTIKKGFAVSFALLASMCLIGAFATSEVQKVWNITVPEVTEKTDWTMDAEMLKHLESDQEDLNAYGIGLWESPYVKESIIAADFHLSKASEGKWMMMDGNEALVLVFDQEGKLTQLSNEQSHYDSGEWVETNNGYNPADSIMGYPEKIEKIYAYLSGFLMQFAPDLYHETVAYTVDGQYRLGNDTYFAELTQRVYEGPEKKLCQIEIEMEPEFRVVRFYRFGEDEDTSFLGNG